MTLTAQEGHDSTSRRGPAPALDPAELDRAVVAAQAGDPAAFEQVVRSTHRELRIFLAVRCHSANMVEEALQATYVSVWENLGRYEPRGTFLSWLKGFGLRRLRRELEAQRRTCPEGSLHGLLAVADADALASEAVRPYEGQLKRLTGCLEALDAAARELIELRYRDGWSLDRLAARLGKSSGALANILFRLRRRLRDCLGARAPT